MASEAVNRVLNRLDGVQRSGSSWTAKCPAHEDHRPSFSVAEGDDGRVLFTCHAGCSQEAVIAALGLNPADLFVKPLGNGPSDEVAATYDYHSEEGDPLFRVVRTFSKRFWQEHRCSRGRDGWTSGLKGDKCGCGPIRRVLYRLPQVIKAVACGELIHVVEGEKDVHAIEDAGGIATCNPMGAGKGKWRLEYSEILRGARVRIVADMDDAGRDHARRVADSLDGVAESVDIVEAKEGKDAADHLAAGFGLGDFVPGGEARSDALANFWAYMPEHKYIFIPTRDLWPAVSVKARVPPQPLLDSAGRPVLDDDGDPILVDASLWLDKHQAVEQMTWAPGEPMLIADRLVSHGGWIDRPGVTCFNLYRPPTIEPGDPLKAEPWVEHVRRVYPEHAEHILNWLAHRVQRPAEKVNHALVLQGPQGTGKDTIIEGAIPAVGSWNVAEVSPDQLLGRFNGFLKPVILRMSEARDLGDTDRYRLCIVDRKLLLTVQPIP